MRIVFAEEMTALRESERAAAVRQREAELETADARAALDQAGAEH